MRGGSSTATVYASRPPRALSAAAALTIVGSMAALLIFGLGAARSAPVAVPVPLVAIDLTPPKPSPTPTERPKRQLRPSKPAAAKGKPSPRNLRNKATQIVAQPVPLLLPPPPIIAAPKAGIGSAANTGASDRIGPGQGAGGIGDGFGGGGMGGDGDGDGDGGGAVTGPRRIRGRLSYDDLPQGLLALGQEASVELRYTVNPDGRVSRCRVVRTSGYSLIDAVACQLIEKRFRFRPAKNAAGRAVRADVIETHTWVADFEAGGGLG